LFEENAFCMPGVTGLPWNWQAAGEAFRRQESRPKSFYGLGFAEIQKFSRFAQESPGPSSRDLGVTTVQEILSEQQTCFQSFFGKVGLKGFWKPLEVARYRFLGEA